LHRHAAVRTELLTRPGIALRLAVAHMIAGSGLWNVSPEGQRADNEAIAQSLGASSAVAGFDGEGGRIRALLGIDPEDGGALVRAPRPFREGRSLAGIFQTLAGMDDTTVMRILNFVMAETLEAHTDMVDTLGALIATDMRQWWHPDQAFFDLLRDKEAINAIVSEVAGEDTAAAHLTSTAKVQKKIIADCLDGTRQVEVKDWQPRYMRFPAQGYTGRFAPAQPECGDEDDADEE
jgi:ParB family chromosome partitioning protein